MIFYIYFYMRYMSWYFMFIACILSETHFKTTETFDFDREIKWRMLISILVIIGVWLVTAPLLPLHPRNVRLLNNAC